jgi:hypothetical protein
LEKKQGRVVPLTSEETWEMEMTIGIAENEGAVKDVEKKIQAIMKGKESTIHSQPQKGWSP